MPDLISQFIADYGPKIVLTAEQISNRASSFWDPRPICAKALVRPTSTQQCAEIIKRCHQVGQIIITHGGLTGCARAADTTPDHIILSTENMTAVEEFDEIGGTITVQAGAILENIQKLTADKGFYFPLDLGARGSCTIGGNAATNAGGINVIRYGMMRNHILGLEVVLADGTIISSMNKVIKNNAGYDLKQLFIGSEGTLGIITKVIIKLEDASNNCQTALVGLDSFSSVVRFLTHMKKSTGSRLTAFEVMWGNYYNAVTEEGGHNAPMDRDHPYYVITECSGTDPNSDAEIFINTLEKALDENIILDAILPKSESERSAVWTIREGFGPLLNNAPIFLYDVSLPIKNMETYIDEVQKNVLAAWPNSVCYAIGHIGDGNLHLFILPKEGDQSLHEKSDQIAYGPLKEIGGSVSAEHGIGLEKKAWLTHSRSDTEVALMKTLKQTMDPKGILNPGVIFDL